MAVASPVTSPRLIGSLRLRFGYGFSGRSLLCGEADTQDTVGGTVRYTVGNNTFGYKDKRLSEEERKKRNPGEGRRPIYIHCPGVASTSLN
jgi:hypothetical protein